MDSYQLDNCSTYGCYRLWDSFRDPQRVVQEPRGAGAGAMNWELFKNPLNWAIVTMMLLIAALGGKYALQLAKGI
jgi:hypothetical protein